MQGHLHLCICMFLPECVHVHGFKNQVYMNHWVGAAEAKMSKTWSLQQDIDKDMQLKNDATKYHRHSEGHTYPDPVCVTDLRISSSFCTYLATSSKNSGARTISRIMIPSFFPFFVLQGKKLGCLEVTPVFVWLTGCGQWGGKYKKKIIALTAWVPASDAVMITHHWEGRKCVFSLVSLHCVVHLELLHRLRSSIDLCTVGFKCFPPERPSEDRCQVGSEKRAGNAGSSAFSLICTDSPALNRGSCGSLHGCKG